MSRVRALFHRDRLTAELDEELQYHLDMLEEAKTAEGMPRDEARLAARRRFGNATLLREKMREIDLVTFAETVIQDVRFAIRMLAKHPGFTAQAVLALSIGIGVNTVVFTAYKGFLLQPLDAKDPGQLVNIYRSTSEDPYTASFSYPDYEVYRDQNRVFSGVVATTGDQLALTGADSAGDAGRSSTGGALAGAFGFRFPSVMGGGAEFVSSLSVSENYFAVLGVNAVRGRVFLPQDEPDLDAHPAVLISENYWQRRFNSHPAVLGMTVNLNGAAFTIIGITPHDFLGTNINVPNFWLPLRLRHLIHTDTILHDRERPCCSLYARLTPGVTARKAQAEMAVLTDRLRSLHSPQSEGSKPTTITLTPGAPHKPVSILHDPGLAFTTVLVMGAVGLVLLIACANVASLQLGRSAARQREIGVRLSLGASRMRIIRQLLTESTLLGLLSGAASILMSWWALQLLMVQVASNLPMEWGSAVLHTQPDWTIFAYVFSVSLIAGILFGLAPALQASRPNVSSALKEEGAGLALRMSHSRLRDLLVGSQVAVCLFLLIGAGLLIRGSIQSMVVNPGYELKRVVWANLNFPPGFGYTHAEQLATIRQLRDRMRTVPGVTTVAVGRAPDGGGLRQAAVGFNGSKPATDRSARTVFYSYCTLDYFETLGIPLIRGERFPAESMAARTSVILSESVAEELWPGRDPIGQIIILDATNQFHAGKESMPMGESYRVIGVARNTRGIIPGGADANKAYLPLPIDRLDDIADLLIRTEGDPRQLMVELGRQVKAVDGDVVVYAETVEGLLTSTPAFTISRLSAIFATIIGVLGLLLACVAIYGTVSYAVVRRTREVGIRMALGAKRSNVLGLILRESGRHVVIGLLVGSAAASGAARMMGALLYGVSALDPISFVGVGGLFFLIAMLAAYLPARRATHVDPMVALRGD